MAAQAHGQERWQPEAERLLAAFSMDHHQGAYPASFSRGMQYKLALAMSLLAAPAALLLDEPYGALDPASQLYLADRGRQRGDAGGRRLRAPVAVVAGSARRAGGRAGDAAPAARARRRHRRGGVSSRPRAAAKRTEDSRCTHARPAFHAPATGATPARFRPSCRRPHRPWQSPAAG